MAEDPTRDKRFDPMEPWRAARDMYMDTWSKTMVDMVNSEAYAQANGAMLDSYMTVSTPFREAVEKAMLKTLEQMAMPTRADVLSIAERMTHIEMRLDDLDAKLDTFLRLIVKVDAAPGPKARKAPQPASKQSTKQTSKAKPTKRGKK